MMDKRVIKPPDPMDERLIQPSEADPLIEDTRAFWREMGKDLVRGSISTTDETAKQIVGVAGILEGLYFHAITFADLRGKVAGDVLWVYLAPIGLLLISLCAALIVFFPDRSRLNFNSSEASKLVYERTVRAKLWALRMASIFLVLGIGGIFVAVIAYLKG
jgi:hypothetical protein